MKFLVDIKVDEFDEKYGTKWREVSKLCYTNSEQYKKRYDMAMVIMSDMGLEFVDVMNRIAHKIAIEYTTEDYI